jgi:hypothetical protein
VHARGARLAPLTQNTAPIGTSCFDNTQAIVPDIGCQVSLSVSLLGELASSGWLSLGGLRAIRAAAVAGSVGEKW